MYRTLPLAAEHLETLVMAPDNPLLMYGNWQAQLLGAAYCGQGFSMWHGDELLLVAGFTEVVPGVATFWLVPGAGVNAHARAVARIVRTAMGVLVETHRLRRIESECEDLPHIHRWMEYLGFQREGVKRRGSIKGTDLIMYGRLYDGN